MNKEYRKFLESFIENSIIKRMEILEVQIFGTLIAL